MIKSNIKKQFSCDKNKLWDIITDNSNYKWRTDLLKIEIKDETHFIEYTTNNFPTYFTITAKEKLKEYIELLRKAGERQRVGKEYIEETAKKYAKKFNKNVNIKN